MAEKRLVGLVIIGVFTIIFSLLMGLILFFDIRYQLAAAQEIALRDIFLVVATLGLFVSSVCIFTRAQWARIMIIVSSGYYIIDTFWPLGDFIEVVKQPNIPALIVISLGMALFISIIVYFLRPDVRKHFN